MNTRSTKAAHGSIYDTLFVARASRETFPATVGVPAARPPVNLYDASQSRQLQPVAQPSVVLRPGVTESDPE
jgi:hypothetical protein